MENCEVVVGNRSLNSGGNARGNLQKGLARIVRLRKGEGSFGAETIWYKGGAVFKDVVARGNVFLSCAAFEAVGTGGWITSRVTFEDPVDYRPANKLGAFDTEEPGEVPRRYKGELIAGGFSGAFVSCFEVQIPCGLLVNVRVVDCAGQLPIDPGYVAL